jgi:hypothetical protein
VCLFECSVFLDFFKTHVSCISRPMKTHVPPFFVCVEHIYLPYFIWFLFHVSWINWLLAIAVWLKLAGFH